MRCLPRRIAATSTARGGTDGEIRQYDIFSAVRPALVDITSERAALPNWQPNRGDDRVDRACPLAPRERESSGSDALKGAMGRCDDLAIPGGDCSRNNRGCPDDTYDYSCGCATGWPSSAPAVAASDGRPPARIVPATGRHDGRYRATDGVVGAVWVMVRLSRAHTTGEATATLTVEPGRPPHFRDGRSETRLRTTDISSKGYYNYPELDERESEFTVKIPI